MIKCALHLADQRWVPDGLVRLGIRGLIRKRLLARPANAAQRALAYRSHLEAMDHSSIAIETRKANEQHYELPPPFFEMVLGPYVKYSSSYFEFPEQGLGEAEEAMLKLYEERSQLSDGLDILELGCGWGSLTLWLAKRFPGSQITAVSNSPPQKNYILETARRRGLANIDVITADINTFETAKRFDRIISIEMFEHLRNYRLLFARLSQWLKNDGLVFVHIFCHRDFPYFFNSISDDDWMSTHFFSGGHMPAFDLFERFSEHLKVTNKWFLNGHHYARSCEWMLKNMDSHADAILKIFSEVYGKGREKLWFQRWRIFFMAYAELFWFRKGQEWGVAHYQLKKV